MRPRFLADADLKRAIITGVKRREAVVDFQTAQDAALEGLNFMVRLLTPGATSFDGEPQILVYPAENAELDARWAEIATGRIDFQ